MPSNPEEVPVSSPIASLVSASMSPENGQPALEERRGEVTAQPKLIDNESFETMSPGSGKSVMPHEGTKSTAPPQPTTVTVRDFNITVSPKPESRESCGSTVTSSTRPDSPTSFSSSSMTQKRGATENAGGVANGVSDTK